MDALGWSDTGAHTQKSVCQTYNIVQTKKIYTNFKKAKHFDFIKQYLFIAGKLKKTFRQIPHRFKIDSKAIKK